MNTPPSTLSFLKGEEAGIIRLCEKLRIELWKSAIEEKNKKEIDQRLEAFVEVVKAEYEFIYHKDQVVGVEKI